MPRKARVAPGGMVYHVLNRSAGRTKLFRTDDDFLAFRPVMLDWPVERRADWAEQVNQPLTRAELLKLEASLSRGGPFGGDQWIARTAGKLDLQHTLRREGRPAAKAPGNEIGRERQN